MAGNPKVFLLTLQVFVFCCLVGRGSASDKDFKQAEQLGLLKVHQLDPARVKPIQRTADAASKVDIDIFCFKGLRTKSLFKIWSSATVKLAIGEDYSLYKGNNETHVYQQFAETARSWLQVMPWRTDYVSMPVFAKTCLGVTTNNQYTVEFVIKNVDIQLAAFMLSGLILFVSAERLSRNVVFYYGTGVSIGVLASGLVLIFIVSRFMPKKYGAYAIMIGGWSLMLYFFQYMWENIQTLVESYYWYFVGYFGLAGLLSFAYCYYKGPVNNPRSLDLIKWSIMLVGLALMYCGCQIPEVAVALVSLLVLWHNFPASVAARIRVLWRRRFPPKRRFLTEEEYLEQGSEETKKALEELRAYCRSPDCDAWKTISRLSSPNKFASWVEGESHLSGDEILSFEGDGDMPLKYDTDNESEISFSLNSQ